MILAANDSEYRVGAMFLHKCEDGSQKGYKLMCEECYWQQKKKKTTARLKQRDTGHYIWHKKNSTSLYMIDGLDYKQTNVCC